MEGAALSHDSFHPEFTGVQLSNAMAMRQPNARSWVSLGGVQASENVKHLFELVFRNTNAVIGDRDAPMAALFMTGDGHLALTIGGTEFQGVLQEVLHQQTHLVGISLEASWQVQMHSGIGLLNRHLQIIQYFSYEV